MPPTMHPDAIDVTDNTGGGKPWIGGSGKPKLGLHTIEAAHPRDLGWPRSGTSCPFCTWTSPPHLGMNAWYHPANPNRPKGRIDWLYQTVYFDTNGDGAGKSMRDNPGEDDRYVWQLEVAGEATQIRKYGDWFYIALAEVCQWFVDNMGVPDVWMDFDTGPRVDRATMDRFSGFMGHKHFGKGIDTHTDPGRLDVPRLRSFMATEPTPPTAIQYPKPGMVDKPREAWFIEPYQAKVAVVHGGNPELGNAALITNAGMKVGVYDDKTVELLTPIVGTARGIGPTEERRLNDAYTLATGGEHNHPQYAVDGHTHKGYSVVTHSHLYTDNTNGADS